MILLFDNKVRTDLDPLNFIENAYRFYDRSGRADIEIIRCVLNKWFNNYPEAEKEELKSRFQVSFSSPFYELFIHEIFLKQGFEITVHPNVPNTDKRPDFLVKKKDIEFYLEAKETKDISDEEVAQENMKNQIYDSINSMDSPNFFFNIDDILVKSQQSPSTRNLRKYIEDEIRKYDAHQVSMDFKAGGYDRLPKLHYEKPNFKISISLVPKNQNYPAIESIGSLPLKPFVGGSEESIKTSVIKKAKRYGKLDKPYIICINSIGRSFTGFYDVQNVIWGSLALTWDDELIRVNGIFQSKRGPINTNVSGVFISCVTPFNIPTAPYWFVKNPYALRKIAFDNFDFSYQYDEKNNIKTKEGKSIGDITGISPTWLNIPGH